MCFVNFFLRIESGKKTVCLLLLLGKKVKNIIFLQFVENKLLNYLNPPYLRNQNVSVEFRLESPKKLYLSII